MCLIFQSAIKKNNPKKYLRSVGDREVVEFNVVEGSKVSVCWTLSMFCILVFLVI